jgi:hypothetical protein
VVDLWDLMEVMGLQEERVMELKAHTHQCRREEPLAKSHVEAIE